VLTNEPYLQVQYEVINRIFMSSVKRKTLSSGSELSGESDLHI